MSKYQAWTKSEDDIIINMRRFGCTYLTISQTLINRSYNAIRVRGSYLINHGFLESSKSRAAISWTKEDEDTLIALKVGKGLPYEEIAKIMYSTPSALSNKMRSLYKKERVFSDKELLDCVNKYITFYILNKARKDTPSLPSNKDIKDRFGSWIEARKIIASKNKPTWLYYVKIKHNNDIYYKIGITSNSVEQRFRAEKDKEILVLKSTLYKSKEEAKKAETLVLRRFKNHLVGLKSRQVLISGGDTEMFNSDVLNLDVDLVPHL